MPRVARTISILIVLMLFISACNLPASATPTTDSNVVLTAAALTLQALSTQPTSFSTPTIPPPAATNTPLSVPTLPSSTRPAASATAMCDLAQFMKDVNIPDGSQLAPGAAFTKTWRLRNAGTCTWSGYTLVFESGELMNGSPQPFGTVAPGQDVDVSVNFTAPTAPGTYRSYWRIRNASGVLLPVLGGTQGKSFFVEIKVVAASSGLDLHTRATEANWISTAKTLTFGGPDDDTNGFVMYRDSKKLEDGSAPAKILEMFPHRITDGQISGTYPSYTVVAGEHFTAKIGFLALSDGSCGSGNVRFQLNYKDPPGGTITRPLGEWTETCDRTLKDIDVDLTNLAGKTVQFVLGVVANGPATDDMAVWVSPRVAIP